jgi:xylulokinase
MADGPRFSTGMSQSRSAVPGLWGSMTAISAGGVCLEWLRSQFGAFGTLPDYQTLDDGAGKSGPGARGVSFFPYFGGQKFPVQDDRVKAAILGLDLSHNPFDLTRAVLEGVAYHVVWVLEGMGSNAQAVKMTGGAAKSRLWRQIVADIAGRSIDVPAAADTACTGAAILAGVGCGVFQDAAQGYAQLGGPVHTVEPSAQAQAYRALFPIYKAQARRLGAFYCAD